MPLIKELMIITAFLGLYGCTNIQRHEMPALQDSTINLKDDGMLLTTIEFSNVFMPKKEKDKEQAITSISIQSIDLSNNEITDHIFKPDTLGTKKTIKFTRYYLRMQLPAGKYRFRAAIVTEHWPFPLDNTYAIAPLLLDTTVNRGKISYVGNISVQLHERKDGESRASYRPLPLTNVHSGFYTGTFKVEVKDDYEIAINDYKRLFPSLAHADISKSILPKYSYERTYEWAASPGLNVTKPAYIQ